MNISFIGAGNVASHLADALVSCGHSISAVLTRSEKSSYDFSAKYHCFIASTLSQIPDSDVYFFCIKDDVLPCLLQEFSLLNKAGLCIHTAGSVSLSAFPTSIANCGVIYPLQTISKSCPLNFKETPLFIEANKSESLSKIEEIAKQLSDEVYTIDSHTRKKLHLAAVFANNFSNHCFAIATNLLAEAHLPQSLLFPIIEETFNKIKRQDPIACQTGPAVRYDLSVMAEHLSLLGDDELRKDIYRSMSESIHDYNEQRKN